MPGPEADAEAGAAAVSAPVSCVWMGLSLQAVSCFSAAQDWPNWKDMSAGVSSVWLWRRCGGGGSGVRGVHFAPVVSIEESGSRHVED